MIKLTKRIDYYNNKKYTHSDIIKKETFPTIEDALQELERLELKYIKNDKGISCYELADIIQNKGDTYYKYTKSIDKTTGEIHTTTPDTEVI